MKTKMSAISFFDSIPDDVLIQIATNDWGALKRLCIALTIDIQLINEEINNSYEDISDWRELC
jgi:hypothetical protein